MAHHGLTSSPASESFIPRILDFVIDAAYSVLGLDLVCVAFDLFEMHVFDAYMCDPSSST